jgi:hypothetical protein
MRFLVRWAGLVFLFATHILAQDAPLISGGVGWLTTHSDGSTFSQPVVAPVAVVPLGNRFVIESRADVRGFLFWPQNGNFRSDWFATLEYLQLDFLANKHLTITAGKFLTPFGTYNERLTPIWIRNFEDAPLIFPIGTRATSYSNGAMLRGSLFSSKSVDFSYAAFFSSASSVQQFQSARAAGFRGSFFFPAARLEAGVSYERFLQGTLNGVTAGVQASQQDANDTNSVGAHFWWQPNHTALGIKSEFAHSPSGYGYWVETAYRLSETSNAPHWYGGFEPLFRWQQFFRTSFHRGDLLPATDTQQADFGVNYYLPRSVRLNANYSRQFAPVGDRNIWNFGVTYRFMLPLAKRGS